MNSKLQNLKDLLKENPAAAEKAKAIPDGKPEEMKDALMSLAKEYGILLEDSDFQSEEEELSLQSLDAVAGGAAAEVVMTVIEGVLDALPESSYTKRKIGSGGTRRRQKKQVDRGAMDSHPHEP